MAILLRSMVVLPPVVTGLVVAVLAGCSSLVYAAQPRRWASLILMVGAVIVRLVPLGVEPRRRPYDFD